MSELFDLLLRKPISDEWIRGLLFGVFSLHMLMVLLTLGTGILALYYFAEAWWGGKLSDVRWDKEILRTFLAHKSLAVVLGVGALLLMQVGSTVPFFTAINFHAASWMLIIVFLIVAFLFLDFLGQREYTHHYLHLAFGVIGMVALLAVPGVFVAVLVTSENPAKWLSIARSGYRLTGPLAFHWLFRYLHVLGAAIVFGGAFHYFFTRDAHVERRKSLLKWIAGGILLQFVLGLMLYSSLPEKPDTITNLCLLVGVTAAAALLWVIFSGLDEKRPLKRGTVVPLLLLIFVPMLLARQWMRDKKLVPLDQRLQANATGYHRELAAFQPEALQEYRTYLRTGYRSGETIYQKSCSFCHGENGNGNGVEAKNLAVPPADLSAVRADRAYLRNVILKGIPGSSMPYFAFLDKGELDRLLAYLDTAGHVFSPPGPIPVTVSPAALDQAKATYRTSCSVCHGADGRGTELSRGFQPRPPDFTAYSLAPRRAFDVISRGYPGTVMPSFASLPADVRWGLVQVVDEKRR
jgi:mono/diheme cytochrome c family protein